MTENESSPCSVVHNSFTSLASKRQKAELSISTKDKKDKVSERVVTLQQLVSPYEKTDTTSVLLEAVQYIRFLHEQVKDIEHYSLRSQGLCLVPILYTVGVARSNNGADIWAPIKTSSPKFAKGNRLDIECTKFPNLMQKFK
ncbi:Basic helix-loop-helix DNA-binding superfamily protein isoform 3 [Hibiscus syriacus]|uniref:Basic helix-loop-helix DNA-binding superfamily protein isoform 3 n=1 Tax=Hibiscus syriacus TaxID=106335 RepID=A0A6A2ZWJ4_HIBSY|nr:Basic helix-loop-helix DNA-binding superfamily protein isoform 3 [Hibiscus syriacus]